MKLLKVNDATTKRVSRQLFQNLVCVLLKLLSVSRPIIVVEVSWMFVCGNIHIGHECQHSDLASPRGVCMPQDMLRTRINHYLFMRNPTTILSMSQSSTQVALVQGGCPMTVSRKGTQSHRATTNANFK